MTKTTPENQVSHSPVGERLRRRMRSSFKGRERELFAIERALAEDQVAVAFVHGIGGIGKTSLLEALEARLCERGLSVLRLDGSELEPTPEGFLTCLSAALGTAPHLDTIVKHLSDLKVSSLVLLIDEYDGLRLLDSWLRRSFVPALPAKVQLVCAGRSKPLSAWTAGAGWDGLVHSLELGPLAAGDAAQIAEQHALQPALRAQICALAKGHPLALKLAAAAAAARPDLPITEIESRHVIDELVHRFLSDVKRPEDRAVVEAASVLRRVTRPLLTRMVGESQATHAFESLRALPFVEVAQDGLVLHQSVRHAVEKELRAIDPVRHRKLRSLAWQQLSEEIVQRAHERRWQVTADVMYLLDLPALREAFFPSDTIRLSVEPAEPQDREAIIAATLRHLGPDEAQSIDAWWQTLPSAFYVVRDAQRQSVAFHIVAFEQAVPKALLEKDPLLRLWQRHLAEHLPNNTRPVLWNRAALSMRAGTNASEERACCFIDIKRLYLQNLDLAAIYAACNVVDDAAFSGIGFTRLRDLPYTTPGGAAITSSTLRFGAGVLPWIARLIDAQCEAEPPAAQTVSPFELDRKTRELCVDGERKPLTRLEYGVLEHLTARRGAVVSRDELLNAAWGQAHTGSNVVDAVVRTLRKKLGPHADAIQTVTGFGYKLRAADSKV